MNAAAYARYSTDKQNENSIESQLDAIIKYCQVNNHTITATFIDEATTGTNINRPGFINLLEGAKKHQFECVVIYDISRGSRDVGDWFNFRKEMQQLNIKVISATEKLGDMSNPNDFLVELINVGLGQHMVLQTRQKSMAGVAQRAKQGVFLGGIAPLGYDIVNGSYVVNQWEAGSVKLIFALYGIGKSYNHIIQELAKKGYKGKRGQPLGKNSLNAILQNERYIGVYTWNKHKNKYMGKWIGGTLNPDMVKLENSITPIIDKETWERVQQRMNNNRRNASNSAKNTYLLSGLIECGECGGTYTGKTNTNSKGYATRYYVCGNKYRNHSCNAKNINADEIETAVVAQLKNYLQTTDFGIIADETLKAYESTKSNHSEERKELDKLQKELQNCTNAIKNGLIYPELKSEIESIQTRIGALKKAISTSSDIVITREMIIDKLKKDVENITADDIPRLVKTYVTKIKAHNNEIIITGGVNMLGCGGRI
ncbi:MAG: hypothetical protein FNP40_15555 [Dehalobacter sp. 4CP]|uniref:recombinase family protein n=1 Tax=Dehalobacter sp. CP TaxID=2594474 RepID=UPI0013C570C9|nr:hypothetical protein [Dehalobacter sp. 4CP]